MLSVDYVEIKKYILKDIRGKLSQAQMSQRLKYKTNQYFRWENNKNNIIWSDFIRLCKLKKINLNPYFQKSFGDDFNAENISLVIKSAVKSRNLQQVSELLGVSRYIVSRWMNGKQELKLEEVLLFFDKVSVVLLPFLQFMCSIYKMPALNKHIIGQIKALSFYYDYPESTAILRVIESKPYHEEPQHNSSFIAQMLKVSEVEVDIILKHLVAMNEIKMQADGKYRTLCKQVPTIGNTAQELLLRKYWTRRSLDFVDSLEEKPQSSMLGYLVFGLNEKDYEKLRQLYLEFFYNLRAIIVTEQSSIPEKPLLLSMNIIDFSDPSYQKNKKT